MPPSDHEDLVTVLLTADVNLLAVVKSVLKGAGIPCFIQGEKALNLLPVGHLVGPFTRRGLAAAVMVKPEHAEAARVLLSEAEED